MGLTRRITLVDVIIFWSSDLVYFVKLDLRITFCYFSAVTLDVKLCQLNVTKGCHDVAQYLCSILCQYGHTDGYKSAAALSNLSQLLIAPWPEQYWHRIVTAPAARGALTGVASPCPEFYVREREY